MGEDIDAGMQPAPTAQYQGGYVHTLSAIGPQAAGHALFKDATLQQELGAYAGGMVDVDDAPNQVARQQRSPMVFAIAMVEAVDV